MLAAAISRATDENLCSGSLSLSTVRQKQSAHRKTVDLETHGIVWVASPCESPADDEQYICNNKISRDSEVGGMKLFVSRCITPISLSCDVIRLLALARLALVSEASRFFFYFIV
ncbi:hypothetical protein Btru_054441 [Bulinus truncatus]|nr:hypothetical protein Btru_054441 [Bulinus truncatus]